MFFGEIEKNGPDIPRSIFAFKNNISDLPIITDTYKHTFLIFSDNFFSTWRKNYSKYWDEGTVFCIQMAHPKITYLKILFLDFAFLRFIFYMLCDNIWSRVGLLFFLLVSLSFVLFHIIIRSSRGKTEKFPFLFSRKKAPTLKYPWTPNFHTAVNRDF